MKKIFFLFLFLFSLESKESELRSAFMLGAFSQSVPPLTWLTLLEMNQHLDESEKTATFLGMLTMASIQTLGAYAFYNGVICLMEKNLP